MNASISTGRVERQDLSSCAELWYGLHDQTPSNKEFSMICVHQALDALCGLFQLRHAKIDLSELQTDKCQILCLLSSTSSNRQMIRALC